MIQKEFVRKLKEKINESKVVSESTLKESVGFIFPIGNEDFNVGYDSSGLGRGKKKVLDKDEAIHNSDYGGGDAKHQSSGGHLGVDIFAPKGTPLISATSGEVYKIQRKNKGRGGRAVSVLTNGIVYYYCHLDSVSNEIKKGDKINIGTFIGTVGKTGNAKNTHPHLHFSMYEKRRGYYSGTIDPWPFLKDSLDGGELLFINPEQVVDKVEGNVSNAEITINDIINNGDNSELISLGSQGDGVEEIQKILDKKNYDLGEEGIDGVFGMMTMKAIKKFQKDEGLNLIDGIVGIETSTALNR